MRLSEIQGERAVELVAQIIGPAANIAADPETRALLKKGAPPDGMDKTVFLLHRVRDHLPALLQNHKADLIAILSACAGVSAAEYAATLTPVGLVRDCAALLADENFAAVFPSAQSQAGGAASTSAPENTAAQAG